MSDYILKVEAINKSFRQHQVVKNISFEVRRGEERSLACLDQMVPGRQQ